MRSFFITIGILFVLILINSLLTPRPKEPTVQKQMKEVSVYRIGQAPIVSISAKVDKAGVVKIVAQTPGIVSQINVENGQEVSKGTVLISLSSNYQGGNVQGVSRQIAATQYQNTKDTYATQKDIIAKQRQLADQQRENTEELRNITNTSIDETQSLVNLNSDILNSIKASILSLQSTNVGGVNNTAIQNAQQLQAQLQAGNNQLQSGLRSAQYQSNTSNPPTEIANITHDMVLEQLQVQEKALNMGLELGRLQLELAQIAEGTMYPAAPFDGVVQEVHVHEGQSVNPGTVLVTFSGYDKAATIIGKVPLAIANKASKLEESTLYIGNKTYKELPSYISEESTDGNLNSIVFSLPDEAYGNITNGQYVKIDVPIGYPDTGKTTPFLPIDSVYQTQDGSYVYVANNGIVESRKVTLGNVVGGSVEIVSGIKNGDAVILDRNVVVGDSVIIENSSYGTK